MLIRVDAMPQLSAIRHARRCVPRCAMMTLCHYVIKRWQRCVDDAQRAMLLITDATSLMSVTQTFSPMRFDDERLRKTPLFQDARQHLPPPPRATFLCDAALLATSLSMIDARCHCHATTKRVALRHTITFAIIGS